MARVGHRSFVSSLAVLALLGAALLASVPPASAAACSVQNVRTGAITDTLQVAVDASEKGDTLLIQGTCIGRTAIRDKALHLKGVPTTAQPTPTLDGDGATSVLAIDSSRVVVLRNLTVTHGRGRYGGGIRVVGGGALSLKGHTSVFGNTSGGSGGGIYIKKGSSAHSGTLTLNDSSSVTGNAAAFGGGISSSHADTTLNGSSSVSGNTATFGGGGIDNGSGIVTLNGSSSVSGNTAGGRGGGIYNLGTLTLNGTSSVSENAATYGDGDGGGIFTYYGTLTLNGSSSVSENAATYRGGAIFSYGSTLTLNDSSAVTGNTALTGVGGGIYTFGALTLNGSSSVSGNTAEHGGGIYMGYNPRGALTLNGSSSVTGNTATKGFGGGIRNVGGSVYVCSDLVAIGPNDPDDPPETLPCP